MGAWEEAWGCAPSCRTSRQGGDWLSRRPPIGQTGQANHRSVGAVGDHSPGTTHLRKRKALKKIQPHLRHTANPDQSLVSEIDRLESHPGPKLWLFSAVTSEGPSWNCPCTRLCQVLRPGEGGAGAALNNNTTVRIRQAVVCGSCHCPSIPSLSKQQRNPGKYICSVS